MPTRSRAGDGEHLAHGLRQFRGHGRQRFRIAVGGWRAAAVCRPLRPPSRQTGVPATCWLGEWVMFTIIMHPAW